MTETSNKSTESRCQHSVTVAFMIDHMVFNAVFNSISVISRRPVHLFLLSWSSFNQYSAQNPFHWLLSHITIVETTDSGESGMNPVTMTHKSLERILAESRIEPATSCSQVHTLPPELWGSAQMFLARITNQNRGNKCIKILDGEQHILHEILINMSPFSKKSSLIQRKYIEQQIFPSVSNLLSQRVCLKSWHDLTLHTRGA